MKLIVGLGNPGKKYRKTKHNIGFIALDSYAEVNGIKYKKSIKFTSEIAKLENSILLKPKTYMNNSGLAVVTVAKYYNISPENIVVISDDLNLPFGKLRLRQNGSAGGHNGIKSIINHLNSENFNRVRVGIGNNKDVIMKDFVLSNFTKYESQILDELTINLNKLIEDFIKEDRFEILMNKYNKS